MSLSGRGPTYFDGSSDGIVAIAELIHPENTLMSKSILKAAELSPTTSDKRMEITG
jgi:hypothetical protein